MEMRSFGTFVSLRGRGAGGAEGVSTRNSKQEERKYEFRGMRAWSFEEMEFRRAVILRGLFWIPKAWLLLCVVLFAVLGLWSLIISIYHSSGSSIFWTSRDQSLNGVALQNLDEISIALLKLGLPLSAYALFMQNARAHSNSSSNDGSLANVHLATGFVPADESGSAGDRHTVRTENGNVDDHRSGMMKDSWKGNVSGSEVSIYGVASVYNHAQQLWVFQNVCYNGSHLIRFQSETCREPEDAAPHGLLKPIFCRNGDLYARRLALVGKETGIPMAEKSPWWMRSRDTSIVWRNETVALLNLDRQTIDPTRFLQKVNMLLLLNNASTAAAFLDRVESFMFLSHLRVAKVLKHRVDGEEKFHRTYLSTILSRVVPMDEKQVTGILHGRGKAADRRVQLDEPFSAATEESPLCFRKAVLTGTLKGSCWPGGEVVADIVREHLTEKFDTKSVSRSSDEWPCLVSIVSNITRRILSSASEEGFQALLNRKTMGLEVHLRDFSSMDFKQQFDVLQMADIVTGFYGPDLILPAMFCRKMTVLVEIFPFAVQDRAHETQALDSGLVYMAHQCEQGTPQDDDSIFQYLSPSACMTDYRCKEHFATVRKVQLTINDLSQLQKLISLARLIASEQNLVRRRNNHDVSSFRVENVISGRGKCRPFVPIHMPSASCVNWISFTSESQVPMTCCY